VRNPEVNIDDDLRAAARCLVDGQVEDASWILRRLADQQLHRAPSGWDTTLIVRAANWLDLGAPRSALETVARILWSRN